LYTMGKELRGIYPVRQVYKPPALSMPLKSASIPSFKRLDTARWLRYRQLEGRRFSKE